MLDRFFYALAFACRSFSDYDWLRTSNIVAELPFWPLLIYPFELSRFSIFILPKALAPFGLGLTVDPLREPFELKPSFEAANPDGWTYKLCANYKFSSFLLKSFFWLLRAYLKVFFLRVFWSSGSFLDVVSGCKWFDAGPCELTLLNEFVIANEFFWFPDSTGGIIFLLFI